MEEVELVCFCTLSGREKQNKSRNEGKAYIYSVEWKH